MVEKRLRHASTGDGWRLGLRHVLDRERFNPNFRPLVIIPGYGMNTFILGWHPNGLALEDYLAQAGFEVWSVALRNMDGSIDDGGVRTYGLADLAATDVRVAIDYVRAHTETDCTEVDLIGCSLGGTLMFAHLALVPGSPVHTLVALGAPLRWVEINSVLRWVFSSPRLARSLTVSGMRDIARAFLPLLEHVPSLLHIYIHPEIIDMSAVDQMVNSVEDPSPVLNEEIVRWMRARDLTLRGVNVTEAVRPLTHPLLCLTGNADGVVPRATARFPIEWMSSRRKEFIEVGDEHKQYAHADLYVSRYSQQLVFRPLCRWLLEGYPTSSSAASSAR